VFENPLSTDRTTRWRRIGALVAAVGLLLPAVQNILTTSASASATAPLVLRVFSGRTDTRWPGNQPGGVTEDDKVIQFKYLINIDNTGETTQRTPSDKCSPAVAGYPTECKWTSAGIKSQAPIYTQGDEADFTFAADGTATGKSDAKLDAMPEGRYLISILADNYKLDGQHFTVAGGKVLVGGLESIVKVPLQPYPLPTATVKAQVFQDTAPTNSAADIPAEDGLKGFRGQLNDYLGQLITDVYGNPLCTDYERGGHHLPSEAAFQDPAPVYNGAGRLISPVAPLGHDRFLAMPIDLDADNAPIPVAGTGGECLSDIWGVLSIPNLGPNRYTLQVLAPNDPAKGDVGPWIQTTTLEGNHDWDAWVMEGATGLDTEFVQGGEPFPAIIFGFVKKMTPDLGGTGTIKGVVDGVHVYVPTTGGATQNNGTIFGGLGGAKLDHPIAKPWISLNDLTAGDSAIWIGQGNADGSFEIPHVKNGNYSITWWDEPQNYILDLINVSVANGEVVDMGIMPLNGWWTYFDGYVFNDTNRNGIKDAGEPGVPNFTLTMRKRENSLMDRGTTSTTTDASGHYVFEGAYPMTQWLVMEAYNDRYYTTGYTYQADNQDNATTRVGTGVDMSVFPIIGLSGRMDWGVHSYDPTGANHIDPRNGGIVGTVSYDTTRNELNPQYAAVEDWQPGVSDLPVKLYLPIPCGGAPAITCDASHRYKIDADGSFTKGQLVNSYLTETWHQPTDCVARDVNGDQITTEHVLANNPGDPCLEGPLMGVQFEKAGFADVNGNYGFGDGCFAPNHLVLLGDDPSQPECRTAGDVKVGTAPDYADNMTPLPGGKDYLVDVEIPNDTAGRPLYKFTREEDINIGNGDQFIPQIQPPACVGPTHVVDVAGIDAEGDLEFLADGVTPNPLFGGDGPNATVNPSFVDIGGSTYEGEVHPVCSMKLVTLANGKSIVPTFNVFTDVAQPGRFWGLLVDDLNFSGDPQSLTYGEKAGIPFAPVGVYDYTNRLMFTTESDYNGLWDVLMPSTNRINCPTPSGVCANLYRFVGNDPGVPGQLNLNFRPEFRTIAAEFEALPGLIVPADLAPSQVGVSVQVPGGQTNRVKCAVEATKPQFFSIDKPFGAPTDTFTIKGLGFGAAPGGAVNIGTPPLPATIVSWSDTEITFQPNSGFGPQQVSITAANGLTTVDGITLHVLGGSYNPNIYEVGPGAKSPEAVERIAPQNVLPLAADHAIQTALDHAAAADVAPKSGDLVVVYPQHPLLTDSNPRGNPRGAYYENLIINSGVKLQGTGPGGINPNGSEVPGAIIDGSAFSGDGPVAADWLDKITATTWQGNQNVNDGAVISIYTRNNGFSTTFKSSIDGFDLRGGDQTGFPNNINIINGTPTGVAAGVVTQGGAIFANANARFLQITNNVIQNNGGAYGTVRIGTPDLTGNTANSNNNDINIANNRIINNAGTNLAGGIGLFSGSDGFVIRDNDICGNFSAEYGGGITVYGRTSTTASTSTRPMTRVAASWLRARFRPTRPCCPLALRRLTSPPT
jgi:SdrD B-like domain